MDDIPWNHQAHLLRRGPDGEVVEGRGVLHQLVGAFLELPPDEQHGLSIRVAGPDWSRDYHEATIRELAARPEYSGGYGRYDSETDPDEPDLGDEPDETVVKEGATGSAPI